MPLRPVLALTLLLLAASALAQTTDPPGQADPERGYQDVGGGAEPVGVNATPGESPLESGEAGEVGESREERAASWLPSAVVMTFLVAAALAILFMRGRPRR